MLKLGYLDPLETGLKSILLLTTMSKSEILQLSSLSPWYQHHTSGRHFALQETHQVNSEIQSRQMMVLILSAEFWNSFFLFLRIASNTLTYPAMAQPNLCHTFKWWPIYSSPSMKSFSLVHSSRICGNCSTRSCLNPAFLSTKTSRHCSTSGTVRLWIARTMWSLFWQTHM